MEQWTTGLINQVYECRRLTGRAKGWAAPLQERMQEVATWLRLASWQMDWRDGEPEFQLANLLATKLRRSKNTQIAFVSLLAVTVQNKIYRIRDAKRKNESTEEKGAARGRAERIYTLASAEFGRRHQAAR
jgi:hypothetical protein